jgi:glutamate formiminotransferase/formiminotetrahydrofolate cyclodeaminase
MTSALVECVPNFSEGRRPEVLDEIKASIAGVQGTTVLDIHSDADHNRSVITFVGPPEAVEEAAFQMIKKAAQLINLENHSGEHPRIGATDVVPFVPISNISMAECVEIAHRVGERVGAELDVPVYFYENAAKVPERKRLEIIRKGGYEGLKEDVLTTPGRKPDCGPAKLGTAGATVIGAREFLIAYNVNLTTDDESIASKIARSVRHSSGGLRFVKALGMTINGRAQVSMNLTNYRKTALPLVVETIRREAERYGVGILNTELVGLIPQEALVNTAVWYTQMDLFTPEQVLEQRMAAQADENNSEVFIAALASGNPTPGGGSAAAYAGAMAAGLVSMVARLTIGKKAYQKDEKTLIDILKASELLRDELEKAVVDDAKAYQQVMAAFKEAKSNPDREKLIQEATLAATEVPFDTAQKSQQVLELANKIARIGNKNAITDAGAAVNLAHAAIISAAYNVRINLSSFSDQKKKQKILKELSNIETSAKTGQDQIKNIMTERGGLF